MEILKPENALKFGKAYIKEIIKALKAAGKDSSGRLMQSFSEDIKEEAELINIIINSEDYLTYVDEGRKPGTYPNISDLEKWAGLEGINQDAVFPIARSIFKFGIPPTDVIDKSLKSLENSPAFGELEQDVATNLEEEFIRLFPDRTIEG